MNFKRITGAVTALMMLMSCTAFGDAYIQDFHVEDGVLNGAGGYGSLYVPESSGGSEIWKIGERAFEGSGDIDYLDTGESVSVIGDAAFYNSTLHSATINYPVEQIGAYAFADSGLESLWFSGIIPPVMGGKALVNTGYIDIYVSCLADRYLWEEEIASVKMDNNFSITPVHAYEETGYYGENGDPIICCRDCGEPYGMESQGGDDGGDWEISHPFSDISISAWYNEYVAIAYSLGIINGKSADRFDPDANMTLAEAAKIAAVIHQYQQTGDTYIPTYGNVWYQPYVDYCYDAGIISQNRTFNWTKNATRAEMAYLFANADTHSYMPNEGFPMTDLPDVTASTPYANEILYLYRSGIAAGSDEHFTYHPNANIKRSEVSALISRICLLGERIDLPKG